MNVAFLLGRAAFNDGKPSSANPYDWDTQRWWDWRIGYRDAEMAWYAEIN